MRAMQLGLPDVATRWLPDLLGWVCLLPVAVAAAQLLYVRRLRDGVTGTRASRTAWLDVAMVTTTLPWIWMILTPVPGPRRRFLVPLTDLWDQLHHPPAWVAVQIGGNLAVFAGFGLLAPLRWRIGPLWIVCAAAVGSATVETAQWFLNIGRVASVDDVLVNAAGAGLASLLSRRWWLVRRPLRADEAAAWLGGRDRNPQAVDDLGGGQLGQQPAGEHDLAGPDA